MTEKPYLIWSQEHGAWWGRDAMGYTRSILNAGRYSHAEAIQMVKDANAHLPPGDFNEIELVDPLAGD